MRLKKVRYAETWMSVWTDGSTLEETSNPNGRKLWCSGSMEGCITILCVHWTAGTDWIPRVQQDVEVLGVTRVADQLYITLA